MKTKSLLILALMLLSFGLKAQIVPEPISKIIGSSEHIFEGKVIRSDSYWNQNGDFIYTSHTIEVSKIFKGDLNCGTVEMLTVGGNVQNREISGSHTLDLNKGDIGVFCAISSNYEQPAINYYPENNAQVLSVVTEEQGFFKYYFDDINPACSNLIYSFDSLQQVYDSLQVVLQLSYTDCNATLVSQQINEYEQYRKKPKGHSRAIPNIVYVTPDKAYGGIGEVITLYGQNFGNNINKGRIFMPNANRLQFWGGEYVVLNSIDIVSWSDTIIEFTLPSITKKLDTTITGLPFVYLGVPGSGSIVVQNDLGEESPQYVPSAYIEVTYSIATEVRYDSTNHVYIKPRVRLIDSDANVQRYIFHIDNNIKSDPIKFAIVQKAVNDWACFTNVYYRLDTTVLATSGNYDYMNSITFASTPGHIVGVTYSTNDFCLSDLSVSTYEMDIILEKDSVDWWYSLNPLDSMRPLNRVDFYQAILHELGHSHLLYHVIDSSMLMFRDQGYRRNIDLLQDSSAVGGLVALNYSLNNPATSCGYLPPTLQNCPTLSIEHALHNADLFEIFPNPLREDVLKIRLKTQNYGNYQIEIYDIYGNRVFTNRFVVTDSGKIELNTQKIPQGVYFVSISSENYISTQKIIKL